MIPESARCFPISFFLILFSLLSRVVMSLERFDTFFSKNANQDQSYHQQCLSFLLADKCVGETISLSGYIRVDVLYRGT